MTEQNPPSWMELGSHSSKNDRNLMAALMAREGIVTPGSMDASFTGGMDITISEGDLFILGSAARQGLYHCWNDADVTVTAVPGESNPRTDIIVAQLNDDFIDGNGLNTWEIKIVKGTAASSWFPPPTPSDAYLLWAYNVPAGATDLAAVGTLNDHRVQTAGLGGVIASEDSGTRQLLSFSGGGLRVPQLVLDQVGKSLTFWDGSVWQGVAGGDEGRFAVSLPCPGNQDMASNNTWPFGNHVTVDVPDWANRVFAINVVSQVSAVSSTQANCEFNLLIGNVVVASKRIRWGVELGLSLAAETHADAITLSDVDALANDMKAKFNLVVAALNALANSVGPENKQDLVNIGDADISSLAGTSVVARGLGNIVGGTTTIRATSESYSCLLGWFY